MIVHTGSLSDGAQRAKSHERRARAAIPKPKSGRRRVVCGAELEAIQRLALIESTPTNRRDWKRWNKAIDAEIAAAWMRRDICKMLIVSDTN